MPSWFQSHLRNATDMIRSAAGEAITYARGGNSVSLTAVKDTQEFDATDEHGLVTRVTRYDWLIKAADLILNSEQAEPARDDIITDANGAKYQVLPTLDESVFKLQAGDTYGLRVHSKLIFN